MPIPWGQRPIGCLVANESAVLELLGTVRVPEEAMEEMLAGLGLRLVGILLDLAARAQAVGAVAEDEVIPKSLGVEERAGFPHQSPGLRLVGEQRRLDHRVLPVGLREVERGRPLPLVIGRSRERRAEAETRQAGRGIALVGAVSAEGRLEDHLGLVLVVLQQDALLGHRAADAGDDPVLVHVRDVLGVEEDLGRPRAAGSSTRHKRIVPGAGEQELLGAGAGRPRHFHAGAAAGHRQHEAAAIAQRDAWIITFRCIVHRHR